MEIIGGKFRLAMLMALPVLLLILASSCDVFVNTPLLMDDKATSKMIVTPKGIVTIEVKGLDGFRRISEVRFILEGDVDITSDSIMFMYNHCSKPHVLKIKGRQELTPTKTSSGRKKTELVTDCYPECDETCGGYNIYKKNHWEKKWFYILPSSLIEMDGKSVLTDTIKVAFNELIIMSKLNKKGGKK